ncbi:hypothetical protein IIB50_01610 [Patescibacteria group bacterium]|nr:hypothetical protein [Patescibacteria group bacterium]
MPLLPKITIKYGKLIDPFFKDSVEKNYPDYIFPSIEEVKKKVELFKEEWNSNGEKLLTAIFDITGLQFVRSHIDVFVVTATPRDMSAPFIIRSRYTPEEFVDMMLHELLHVLFGDNKLRFLKIEGESDRTLNHIEVFAVLTKLYKDTINDEIRLGKVRDKSYKGNNLEYKRAWELVDKIGYEKIIKELRS